MAQPDRGINNLATLIKRLEAATSRLEDLTTIVPTIEPVPGVVSSSSGAAAASTSAPPVPQEDVPPVVEEFDELIANEVAKYVRLSQELGGVLADQAKAVEKCFEEQRTFLILTTRAKKPGSELMMQLVAGMQKRMMDVGNFRENNRQNPHFNHLSTVSEGVPGLAWVTCESKPAQFVGEMVGAAKFYGNRVLKEYKGKDQKHVDWVNSYYDLLTNLENYVKKHHKMGLTWNANGVDAQELMKQKSDSLAQSGAPSVTTTAAPSISGGPPPPPPPPGPPPVLGVDGSSTPKSGADMGGVFAELNRGESVTAGLKKVDKSQMTHKNPALRASSVVPARSPSSSSLRGKSPAPPSKTKPAHLTKKKPPKKELDGNKWIIEYNENENLVIEETEINQSIFIFRCKGTTIQIKGKVNQISINECVKTNVIGDSLVSGVDVIKSNSFAVQILDKIPTIQIDQCDGGTVYIPKNSLDCEVFTSKSTAVNVYIPGAGEDGDYAECALPEQLRHTVKNGKLVSEIVEHAG